jgi:hypothetical protein
MSATTLKELVAVFGFDIDSKTLAKFDEALKNSENKISSWGESIQSAAGKLTTFATLPILAGAGFAAKIASDAEEASGRFENTFSQIGKDAEFAAGILENAYGRSVIASRELLTSSGDLFKQLGFGQKQALDLSLAVNELAVDLAGYKNIEGGAEEVSQMLTRALTGQQGALKGLGVSITEDEVKNRRAQLAVAGYTFKTQRQAEAMATYQLILERTKDAQGDYSRNSDSLNGTTSITKKLTTDIAVAYGKYLLPILIKINKVMNTVLKFFSDLNERQKITILIVAGVVAAIGPLLGLLGSAVIIVGQLTIAIGVLSTFFAELTIAEVGAALSLAALVAEFLLFAAIIALVADDLIAFYNGEDSVLGLLVNMFKGVGEWINGYFMRLPDVVRGALASIMTPIRAAFQLVSSLGGALGALSGGDFGLALEALKEGVKNTFDVNQAKGSFQSAIFGGASAPAASAPAGSNNNVNAPITITVPQGTRAEDVGPFVQTGVRDSLSEIFADTNRQIATPIRE